MNPKTQSAFRASSRIQAITWQIGDIIGSPENSEMPNEAIGSATLKKLLHDLRSPLSVLGLLKPRVAQMDSDVAQLIQLALGQIDALSGRITGASLDKSHSCSNSRSSQVNARELLANLEILVDAKRMEHLGKARFESHLRLANDERILKGQMGEWLNIFSNILNNAVESSEQEGLVGVTVETQSDGLVLKISDEGKGLTDHQIQSFNSGITFSTKDPSRGIGLKGARDYLTQHGGKLSFENLQLGGLKVSILIPFQSFRSVSQRDSKSL